MIRFVIVATIILGASALILIDTGSVYLALALMVTWVVQWDQAKRLANIAYVVRRLWTSTRGRDEQATEEEAQTENDS